MTEQTPWPACIGTYEVGHVQCDGDPSSKSEKDRKPCHWRDRCGGFQAHLESVGSDVEDYMVSLRAKASGASRSAIEVRAVERSERSVRRSTSRLTTSSRRSWRNSRIGVPRQGHL